MHPHASWTLLYEALVKMDKTDISQDILKKYLSGLLYIHSRLLYIAIYINNANCFGNI